MPVWTGPAPGAWAPAGTSCPIMHAQSRCAHHSVATLVFTAYLVPGVIFLPACLLAISPYGPLLGVSLVAASPRRGRASRPGAVRGSWRTSGGCGSLRA